MNRRENQTVNLSSWSPLGGQKHWPTDEDFLLLFGSILPAHKILPFGVVQGTLVMKCRISDDSVGDASHTTLNLTELGIRLEDVDGAHVNGRNSLLVLKRALSCHRTMNYNNVLASYHQFLKAQSQLKVEKMNNEKLINTVCALGEKKQSRDLAVAQDSLYISPDISSFSQDFQVVNDILRIPQFQVYSC